MHCISRFQFLRAQIAFLEQDLEKKRSVLRALASSPNDKEKSKQLAQQRKALKQAQRLNRRERQETQAELEDLFDRMTKLEERRSHLGEQARMLDLLKMCQRRESRWRRQDVWQNLTLRVTQQNLRQRMSEDEEQLRAINKQLLARRPVEDI